MKILGIDEAGRGPVVGPMMLCGYMIDSGNIEKLRETGVKDSKLLTEKSRKKMAPKLKKLAADYVLLKVSAEEIDKLRTVANLNKIEIMKMREIIKLLNPDKVIIDAPERNTKKFKEKIRHGIANGFDLVAENFADKNHVEVAAASVLAKVHRDVEIEKLHKKYGFFGSGYPSDERTIAFLKNWIKVNKEFPPFVRKSWITAITIRDEHNQRKIREFVK